MAEKIVQTVLIQAWLDRLRGGDETARGELLNCACGRLRKLARKMLKGYPNVRRWEQTDDVLQNAVLRLHRTLRQLAVETTLDFFRLAALHVRRELLDLARHYYGPQGQGARHASDPGGPPSETNDPASGAPADLTHEPSRLACWGEFHEQIAGLPEEEREVFELLRIQGLSYAETAEVLKVSESTVHRRLNRGLVSLEEKLADLRPATQGL